MIRKAFLALILVPWSCRCLVANIVNSRSSSFYAPSISSPTASFLSSLGTQELDVSSKYRNGNNLQDKQQIYLFSLNWIQESDPEYFRKKDVRRLWEWKDTTLGDGRDFFVPKPKTLMALQQYFMENIPNMVECSIISNSTGKVKNHGEGKYFT